MHLKGYIESFTTIKEQKPGTPCHADASYMFTPCHADASYMFTAKERFTEIPNLTVW